MKPDGRQRRCLRRKKEATAKAASSAAGAAPGPRPLRSSPPSRRRGERAARGWPWRRRSRQRGRRRWPGGSTEEKRTKGKPSAAALVSLLFSVFSLADAAVAIAPLCAIVFLEILLLWLRRRSSFCSFTPSSK